jgi:N6-adenosine-specific RNA methylase IME4
MRFKLIYADPPWKYRNEFNKNRLSGTAASQYQTHDHQEIASWPVGNIAAKDSLLFLWAVLPKLPEALHVMSGWGFEYVGAPFVWRKVYRKKVPSAPETGADVDYMGTGFWTRAGAEVVLLGRRGKGLPRSNTDKNIKQLVSEPVGRHSAKPPVVREKILKLVGDVRPRIELFARGEVPGWTATGLESDGRTLTDAVQYYENMPDLPVV